ncbi:hypothetical protein BHE74_00010434 [Ensete ventricosum]|nr:hypothetical protein BHE74_00010434 [Ensete ventricosum]RZR78503.1 hypothetical protein BHM03_00003867 [Ensete ventricosum]
MLSVGVFIAAAVAEVVCRSRSSLARMFLALLRLRRSYKWSFKKKDDVRDLPLLLKSDQDVKAFSPVSLLSACHLALSRALLTLFPHFQSRPPHLFSLDAVVVPFIAAQPLPTTPSSPSSLAS